MILHTYNRFPVVLDHGQAVCYLTMQMAMNIWISEPGLQYVALGYGDPKRIRKR